MPAALRARLRRSTATLSLIVLLVPHLEAREDVRALWVVRTTLTSPAAIDAMVEAARAGGFNTLLVQIRGRGDTFYLGASEPRATQLTTQPPSFDPLAHTIARAHAAGLRVHAWVNVNLVASVSDLPADRRHVVHRHPEWLMIPRALAEELLRIDPSNPQYLLRLAEYVRARTTDLEGLYLSPLTPEAAEYTTRVVSGIVRRYALDGIHLDYVRFPADDFDYSRTALNAFRRHMSGGLDAKERRFYDARLPREPFTYVEAFPERWQSFRRDQLTKLVAQIRRTVKAARPAATLSAAVIPDPTDASVHRMQDWAGWIATGLLDVICPMAYTTDPARFARQLTLVRTLAERQSVWTGIGAYQLSEDQIVANVRTARDIDVGGIIFFSYDSLAATPRGPAYVADIGRLAFAP